MTVREYLLKQRECDQVTFIIAHAVKDSNTPFNHYEYRTTPIDSVYKWLDPNRNTWHEGYIVINADHPPIDITGGWGNWYKRGQLKCAVITKEEDIRATCGGEKQTQEMIDYYERTVK